MRTNTIYHIEYWLKKGFSDSEAKILIEKSKKETSWRCVEFWLKRGVSKEDALKEISKKQSEISIKRDRTKKIINPYDEGYYINKGINDINVIKCLIKEHKNKTNPYLKWSSDELKNVLDKRKITYYQKTKRNLYQH